MYQQLLEFSSKAKKFKDVVENESQTRSVLIDPILRLLGYNTANPTEVISEYTADIGTKKGEKVDYAIVKDDELVMLIEAKDVKVRLNNKNIGQLFRYYSVSNVRVALLTNGLDYWFFTDTLRQNVMDAKPFFKFNVLDFTQEDAETLLLFTRDNIRSEIVRDFAINTAFRKAFLGYFIKEANAPSDKFVTYILDNIDLDGIHPMDATNLVSLELSLLLGELAKKTPVIPKMENVVTDGVFADSKIPVKKRVSKKDIVIKKLEGVVTLDECTNQNCSRTKPQLLMIQNKRYEVQTWVDVLVSVVRHCVAKGKSEEFIFALDGVEDPAKGWIRPDPTGMRAIKDIDGTDLFMDTHGSSWECIRRTKIVCEKLGVPLDKVKVEMQKVSK